MQTNDTYLRDIERDKEEKDGDDNATSGEVNNRSCIIII